MTIRDPEVLETLRDEPELLAIADAVTVTGRLPRPSHRRVVSRAAPLVAVGAVALVVALLWPGTGGRSGILGRALAAIGNGPVLHLVVRMPVGEQLVDVKTGRTTVPSYEVESWSDRDFKRFHIIFRLDGRIVGEMLYPQDGLNGMSLTKVDPAYTALWTGYREALAEGSAKIEREGTLDGHRVYWLTFPGLGHTPARNEVAIDRKTYEPLDFRFHLGKRLLDQRVLLARTEPVSAAAFNRQTARPNPVSGFSHGSAGHAGEALAASRTRDRRGEALDDSGHANDQRRQDEQGFRARLRLRAEHAAVGAHRRGETSRGSIGVEGHSEGSDAHHSRRHC
jgi:hypothetical protein